MLQHPKRTRMACRNRDKVKVNYKKGLWSPDEDQRLRDYIIKHGLSCWSLVPVRAGLQRNGKSCRLRWINYLRPGLKRGIFSREEEETVIRLQAKLGNKWSQIAVHLPGRTDNEVKNYWNSYLKKEVLKIKGSGPHVSGHSAAEFQGTTKCKEINDQIMLNVQRSDAPESRMVDSVQSTATSIESSMNETVPKQLPEALFTDWAPSSYPNGHTSLNFEDGMTKLWNYNNAYLKKVNWTDSSENYGQQSSSHISRGLHDITSSYGGIPEQFAAVGLGHTPEEELLNLFSTGQFYDHLSMSSDFSSCL